LHSAFPLDTIRDVEGNGSKETGEAARPSPRYQPAPIDIAGNLGFAKRRKEPMASNRERYIGMLDRMIRSGEAELAKDLSARDRRYVEASVAKLRAERDVAVTF
jgi:hypothetical protein